MINLKSGMIQFYVWQKSQEFAQNVNKRLEEYDETKDSNIVVDNGGTYDEAMYALFRAGQSKRIWSELYKV